MIKRVASGLTNLLPSPLRRVIHNTYWRAKSTILYRYLYGLLKLDYQLRSGIKLQVASLGEWWTYNDIFVNREYDAAIEEALARSGPGHFVALDLGANVGYFTLRFADLLFHRQTPPRSCEIILIEGSPHNFRELSRRLVAQTIPGLKYQLVHGLVGQKNGWGSIRESAIHVKNTTVGTGGKAQNVAFVDLEKIVGNEKIDLLKCDIEGAELSFLENYPELLRRVDTAIIELHHGLCDTSKCRALLSAAGLHEIELRGDSEVSVSLFSR